MGDFATISANGLEFAYLEAGSGPLLLLMHGFPDTAHTWEPLLEPLANLGYHVVAPNLRGYAPTGIPDRDTTEEDLGRDVLALMDAFGADTASLVGHDWGVTAVIAAASMAPERIERIVTVAIPHPLALKPSLSLLWGGRHFFTLTWPGAIGRFRRGTLRGVDTLVRRWAPSWAFTEADLADVKQSFAEPESLHAALGYYRAFRFGPKELYKTKLPMPALAIAGREDIAPVDAFHRAKRAFTGPYEVVELDCGHFPQRERTAEVLAALERFLRQ